MRLLVELLLGLALLSPVAEASFYRTTGKFYCRGKPTEVNMKIIEHDPGDDDVREFTRISVFDECHEDGDFFGAPMDPLELSIHATFDCHGCKGELYTYLDYFFQHNERDDAKANPMIMGTVELSDICKYGEAKSRYHKGDDKELRRKWLLRDDKVNILDHWDLID